MLWKQRRAVRFFFIRCWNWVRRKKRPTDWVEPVFIHNPVHLRATGAYHGLLTHKLAQARLRTQAMVKEESRRWFGGYWPYGVGKVEIGGPYPTERGLEVTYIYWHAPRT